MADMKELEAQFLKLKEEYIVGKQMLIDQKLKEIEEETAEEFVIPLQKFKQNMDMRLNLTSNDPNTPLTLFISRRVVSSGQLVNCGGF